MPFSQTVEIWPSFAQAQAARMRRAHACGGGLFGTKVCAFDAWVEELWRLHGDGSAIVRPSEREMLVASLLRENDVLSFRTGSVRLLSSIVSEGLGFRELECALDGERPSALSESEGKILDFIALYRRALRSLGLVERGESFSAIKNALAGMPPRFVVDLRSFDDMSPLQASFFDGLAAAGYEIRHSGPDVVSGDVSPELARLRECLFAPFEPPVEAGGSLRLLLPTGRYARDLALSECIAEAFDELGGERTAFAVEGYPVVVSCKDALSTFSRVSPFLVSRGISCAVRGGRSFSQTAFGRAFLSVARFVCGPEESRSPSMLSDFVASPFSGVGVGDAQRFDAVWRQNRDLANDKDAMVRILEEWSDWAELFVEMAESGDALQVKGLVERHIASHAGWSEAFRAEQLQALSTLVETGNAAIRFGVPFSEVLDLLAVRRVSVSAEVSASGSVADRIDVLVCEEACAATLPESSSLALISCDMSATAYPVKTERGAKESLFEKLGIPCRSDALSRARARFARVVAVPSVRLVLERELNTVDADESYPSVMYEEVLDCYRRDLASDEEIDRTFRVPTSLLEFVSSKGEERYGSALSSGRLDFQGFDSRELAATGSISEDRRGNIVVTFAGEQAALSPTQVESYLDCPYKWFSHRRLRLEPLDMGFGSLEMGVLVHDVMSHFYQAFQQDDPGRRVTGDNVDEAERLCRAVFAERFEKQRRSTKSTRVAPIGALEMAQVEELMEKVVRFVRQEADFLPGFRPCHSELKFGKDNPVSYAGFALMGSIDRIDVDDKGRAVVVDYKGSLGGAAGGAYMLLPKDFDASEGFVLPRKVQTLMYAQVARRELGLDVVGALYVNYGNGSGAGAIDDRVIDPALARMAAKDRKRCSSFEAGFDAFGDLLDEVERRIGLAIQGLLEGNVRANPSSPEACKYCPVEICDQKESNGLH